MSHPLAKQTEIAIAELEQIVMSSRKVSLIYFDMLVSACRKHGFSPQMLHGVRSVSSQIVYVSCGQGVALVPKGVEKLTPQNVVVKPLKEEIMIATSRWHGIATDIIL